MSNMQLPLPPQSVPSETEPETEDEPEAERGSEADNAASAHDWNTTSTADNPTVQA